VIHPTAIIDKKAELDASVEVGPYAVIGADVKIGANTTIGANAIIEGPIEIGCQNRIFPGASLGLEPQDLKYKGEKTWVKIGDQNTIREFVTINRATGEGGATIIGNHNLLMAYVHIAHNCIIEDRVTMANYVGLAGHVHVESKAVIGGMLGIHQFVRVGTMAMLGGMSRVDRDVPPYMLIEGSPARVRSLNSIALKRNNLSSEEISLLKKAFRTLYRCGLTLKEGLKELQLFPDNKYIRHLREFLQLSITEETRRGPIPGIALRSRQ
jgi:UDP-N-acetylglucosamine acyltransferase